MKKATLIMLEEAKEIMLEENDFYEVDFHRTVETKGEVYSIFGWNRLDEDEEVELREILNELCGMDVEHLYFFKDGEETTIGGHDFNDIFKWYKDAEDLFGRKNEKIVLFRDLEDGTVLSGVVVDAGANPMAAINKVTDNVEDWEVDDIISEWGTETIISQLNIDNYYV